jgi:poly(hydroxyalkanoate) depolymerase family esterase
MTASSVAKTLAAVLITAALTATPATAATAQDHTELYRGAEGTLQYQVHLPPAYAEGASLPVVVALHGCGMTGFRLNSMKDLTNLDEVADEEGFIVVYPTQNYLSGLPLNCWNGDDPAHQRRGHGEPALIAGLTEEVLTDYHADRSRVHVLGASSGAGTAVIMGVTYPDVYASVMSMAGAEYAVNEANPDDPDEIGPVDTAKRAWAQMGPRARPVPVMVVQGDQDTAVPPFLADRLVTHWATIDDLAVDGVIDGDVDDVADREVTVSTPGEHSYVHRSYEPRGGGQPLIEYYLVHGMVHAWPGPGSGAFVDNAGPDLARLWWDWARQQRLP